MKKLLLLLMLCVCIGYTYAQQTFFVYLQTDTKEPFYVKLKSKTLNSSPAGYLLLSKINSGSYNLRIGFPANNSPEQIAKITVDKNKGYHIKRYGATGWALLDVESNQILPLDSVMPAANVTAADADRFAEMLSVVVNDPNLITKNDTAVGKIPVPTSFPDSNNISFEVNSDTTKVANNQDTAISVIPITSVITKQFDHTSAAGIERIYIDQKNDKNDTVIVFIPAAKIAVTEENNSSVTTATTQTTDTVILVKPAQDTLMNTKPPIVFTADTLQTQQVPAAKTDTVNASNTTMPMPNSDCRNYATEADFIKLRKKMVNENNDDDMILAAKKYFKTKCFTTAFIKNLGVLFLTDAGKYNFFDAAYPFASDSSNFIQLQTEIKDPYYLNRFLAMLRK